jgi:Zn-dependent M28 family amino/carboxypeptidase
MRSLQLLIFMFISSLNATYAASDPTPSVLERIRERALASDWAYQRLADLTDKVGPRLSGSPQAEAAVDQVAQALRQAGFTVTLQPVRVPHWVRGLEQASIVDYPQRPTGVTQTLRLTTLGGSVATPEQGLTAPVLVVKSFAELSARGAEAKGCIVVFDTPYDQELADNGFSGPAYGQGVAYRRDGASAAARVGAVAALIRSVGGANFRLPHTGQMQYAADAAKIPTAALSAEDAALLDRLAAQGKVTVKLLLTPQTLAEVDSHNVIADWRGSERPDEIVLLSGHLDSWDLATGAIDDGAGVAAAMGAAFIIKELQLRPKRTLRVVAWMNEENGSRGSRAYVSANQGRIAQHAAVIESDVGAGKPLGFAAYVTAASLPRLQPVMEALRPIGATVLDHSEEPVSTDIGPLQAAGVPGFEPLLDARHYFDYHHTAADTLDKVEPLNLRRMVASLAVLAYELADAPQMLERNPPVAR